MPQAVDDKRIARITYPTAAYTLEQRQIVWVEAETKRRGFRSKSEFMRELIERAIERPDEFAPEPKVA